MPACRRQAFYLLSLFLERKEFLEVPLILLHKTTNYGELPVKEVQEFCIEQMQMATMLKLYGIAKKEVGNSVLFEKNIADSIYTLKCPFSKINGALPAGS